MALKYYHVPGPNGAKFSRVPQTKYHSNKTEYDGRVFDSQKEAGRYAELKMLERAGRIRDLRCQVKFELIPTQRYAGGTLAERACNYIADFVYHDINTNNDVVEDCKGYKLGTAYEVFKIKRKLMLYVHGIHVQEV